MYDEMKGSISEENNIGIYNCRRVSRVDIIYEEVKWWTPSLKKQESPPKATKTKYYISLEQMKRKVKRASLEWDDFVLQEKLKSLMYVDPSLRGDPKKDKLIDDLTLKKIACV